MASRANGKHGIRIPGTILDSIRDKEEKGDYEDSSRFRTFEKKRKRNEKPVSRKEKRQEERKLKKQRQHKPKRGNDVNPGRGNQQLQEKEHKKNKSSSSGKERKRDENIRIVKEDELVDDDSFDLEDLEDEDDDTTQDPLEALRKLKESKQGKANDSGMRIVKEDELEDDDSDVSLESDPLEKLRRIKQKKEPSNDDGIRIVKADELEDDEVSDFEGIDDDDEAFGGAGDNDSDESFGGFGLAADEDASGDEAASELEEVNDPISELRKLKQAKKAKSNTKSKKNSNRAKTYDLDPATLSALQKDDEDIEFYAKKLGLKNGRKAKLSKIDDEDDIGGLLDGIDLDFGSEEDVSVQSEEELSEPVDDVGDEEHHGKAFSSDDTLSEGDFEDGDESEDDFDSNTVPTNENPYVAPTQEETTKYIPPAIRRKMALEAQSNSPEVTQLQRSIKGGLNKLSEANISSIVNEINSSYLSNPRQLVHENITNIVIDSVIKQGRLLDTFVHQHACLVVALYRLQGPEFGAHFIQTLVEKFLDSKSSSGNSTEASNIIALLSSVYLFQLVSCSLLYDIIKDILHSFNEKNAELLLKLIKTAGNQMRTDDPGSLKEIILLTNEVTSSMKNVNPRTQFLIETIASLKNNKLKIGNENSFDAVVRLRKFLGGLSANKFSDPIQVTLEDIKNVETKGKWWLIGSAWKGNMEEEASYDHNAMEEILGNAEPNWMQIAKEQRMNTDIRRAIFISIMSAEDYVDALTKLDKLSLKRAQEREIPRILIHCVSVEPSWNPYYGFLAQKLCDSHSYRKTFQFMFWDILKNFEGAEDDNEEKFSGFDEDQDEESKLKRSYNLGRLFGALIAEGSLPLHILRNVNFLVASADTKLFLEIILVTFLEAVAKKSQMNAVGTGLGRTKSSEVKFSDNLLIERVVKAKEEVTLLRGIQYFLQDKVAKSDFVNSKKQKKRVEWGANAMFDIIDELLQHHD